MNYSLPRGTLSADVIVIGAGVLGTFHAYFAAQKGYKTLLLERNMFPNDASTRNFGMVVQSIVEIGGEWSVYARDSAEIYRTIQQEHDISVKVSGSLYIASTETERRILQEFSQVYGSEYDCTFLNEGEALSRYTFIQASYCKGALLFPGDLTLEPRRMLRQLIPYIAHQVPVDYISQANVISVESTGKHCIVKDAQGNVYAADKVFVCSGAEYRTLFPEFFQKSGLKICKLQMMQTVPQPQGMLPHSILSGLSIQRYPAFKSCPSYHLLQEYALDEHIMNYGIHLLFKQASDGSVIIGDSHEYSDFQHIGTPEGILVEDTNTLINEAILRYGQRMITLSSWKLQKMWNGYYLIHPESQAYTETIDGVIHIVTGIAGKGMSTGPGFARKHIDAVLT